MKKKLLAINMGIHTWLMIIIGLLSLSSGILIGLRFEWFLLFILIILVIASIIFSTLHERFAINLLAFFVPIAGLLRFGFLPTTYLVLPGALAVWGLIASILKYGKKIYINNISLFFGLLLFFWSTTSMAVLGSVGEARPYWLVIFLLFLIPNLLTQKAHLLQSLWFIVVQLGLVGAYVSYIRASIFLSGIFTSVLDLRHSSFLAVGGNNIIAMWMTMGLSLVYYMFHYYKGRRWQRFILLILAGTLFTGHLFMFSIGGTLGLLVLGYAIFAFEQHSSTKIRFLLFGLFVVIFVLSGPISERFDTRNITSFDSNWGTNRGELWMAGIQTIQDHPAFGIGLQQARRIELVKHTQSLFIHNWHTIGILTVPHNIFLSIAVDTGLPGLIFYLGMIISITYGLWKIQRYRNLPNQLLVTTLTKGLLVALITGWVQGMGLSVHLDKITWFLMGSAIALSHIVSQDNKHA